jgi:hypothetical protein
MRIRSFAVLSLVLVGVFLSEPALSQRNRYQKRKGGNKKVSSYRGASAGKFRPYEYLTVGLNAMNYYGDLAPINRAAKTDVSFTRPGIGVTYGLRLYPNFGVRANYNFGRIKGDDISSDPTSEADYPRYARNLSFRNNINEFNIGANFYLFADNNAATYRRPINAYLFIGGGFFIHDPKGKVPEYDYQTYGPNAAEEGAPKLTSEDLGGVSPGDWVKLRELRTEGQEIGSDLEPYKPFQWQIPVNLGVELAIPRTYLSVGVELGFRYIFTDYLDDVSNNYVGLDSFDNTLSRIMSDRGAEPTNGFGNVDGRIANVNIVQNNFDGERYYIAGDIGSGIEGAIRGNPTSNDTYFVTQVKLKLILPPNGLFQQAKKAAAKFR